MLFFLSCLHIVGCVDCGFNYAVLFDSGPVVKRSLCERVDGSSFGISPTVCVPQEACKGAGLSSRALGSDTIAPARPPWHRFGPRGLVFGKEDMFLGD